MEDAADTVVPLRPGFDVQFRGYHRGQVTEHIEMLEDQLKIVSIDRNEAVELSSTLRSLYDDARQDLNDIENRLRRIGSSDTGLPEASQRVQNMFANAEEEIQELREHAQRQAETIRGAAESNAAQLVDEAERNAAELRKECSELIAEVERQREQMRREHAKQIREQREREQRMRRTIRSEYQRTVDAAQQEADELISQAQKQAGQLNTESEQLRAAALEDIEQKRSEMEQARQNVLAAMRAAGATIGESASALHSPPQDSTSEVTPLYEIAHVQLPDQREDSVFYTIPTGQTGRNNQSGRLNGPNGDTEARN